MSDIDQIIAGGAKTNADFDFGKINKSYWEGLDQRAKNDLRDAFKPTAENPTGVPLTPDGQPDGLAMAKVLFQKGGLAEGAAAANLGVNQQNIQQNRNAALFAATGKSTQDDQSTIVSPPSASAPRLKEVAAPLNKGGVQGPGQSPQGDQPGSIVGLVSAAGIPDELAGPYINQISAQMKMDPNAALNPELTLRVQQVAQAAAQRMKGGQQPQGAVQQPPQVAQAPMQPPQGQMQPPQVAQAPQQPPQGIPQPAQTQQAPFANAVSSGLIPPGVDPLRFVAGLKLRAAGLQPGPAQASLQKQVDAIEKSSELTQGQKDFAAAQANPKLNEFQNQQEADKASAVARAGNDVKEQQAYIDNGKVAQARLGTLNTISNVIGTDKNLNLGFGSETTLKLKMAVEKLGFDVGDLSGAQIIQKLNGVLASESTKSLATRPTQFEFKTFLGNNPGLALDEKGNIRMLGILSQNAKREVELGKLARSNQGNWDNWDNVVEAYDKKNPIKDPTTGNILSNHSILEIRDPKTGKTLSTSTMPGTTPKLEPGKTMVNGHVFKGGNPNDKANWELRS